MESWFRTVKYPKGKVSKMRKTFIFDFPKSTLVTEYVKMFDEGNNREDFYKDEAIKKLFALLPKNNKIDEVLAKVALLNSFYGTQILDIDLINVASEIVSVKIDNYLGKNNNIEDISVVNKIAYGMKEYPRNLYSFASKYSSINTFVSIPLFLIIFSTELATCSSVDKLVYTSYP